MAMTDNKEKQPADKIEEGIKESVPKDMGYGWFKWNFVVYPSLLAFTMGLLVLQDIIDIIDLALSIVIIPFAAIYAVLTGKWIEEEGIDFNEENEKDNIQDEEAYLRDDNGSKGFTSPVEEDDIILELDDDEYDATVDDDGFVEIEIE